jgi:glycosyltransferase 2 family protein
MFSFAQHDRMGQPAMKRAGIILLQVLVTGAGIWYVFHDSQKRAQIAGALRHADFRWVFLGWLCYSIVELLATARWQILLRIQGISIGWLRAAAIVMIGLFFNQFLPGGVGGDAMRLYFIFKEAPGKKVGAALSVVMDRLFGLLTILFLTGVSFALRFKWLTRSGTTLRIECIALVLLGAGIAFVVLFFWLARFGRLPKTIPFRYEVIQSGNALLRYRAHPAAMALAFSITIASHVAYYINFFCAGEALRAATGHAARLVDVLSIMPLVNTITSVPISLGGAGVREALFQELLGTLSRVPPAIAAFTASLGYLNQISWALVGGAIFLFSKKIIR